MGRLTQKHARCYSCSSKTTRWDCCSGLNLCDWEELSAQLPHGTTAGGGGGGGLGGGVEGAEAGAAPLAGEPPEGPLLLPLLRKAPKAACTPQHLPEKPGRMSQAGSGPAWCASKHECWRFWFNRPGNAV